MKPGDTKVIPSEDVHLTEISHVCVVVRDVEEVANRFARMGLGPFTIRMVKTPAERASLRGRPTSYTLKFGYAQTGSIVLELVEPVEGDSHYSQFLQQNGEGIHHIGFDRPGMLDDELDRWEGAGMPPVQINRREDTRYGWAYLDTEDAVGCILEVVCDPPLGWWETKSLLEERDTPTK